MTNIEEWDKIKKHIDDVKGIDVYNMAKEFHVIYEQESMEEGWNTQKKCRVSFDKLPEKNKKVMLRTCARMIEWISNNQEDI